MAFLAFLPFLVFLGPHDIDRSGVERGLEVRCVVFLDHLDTYAAVFGDLVDVGTLHQTQADLRGRSGIGNLDSPRPSDSGSARGAFVPGAGAPDAQDGGLCSSRTRSHPARFAPASSVLCANSKISSRGDVERRTSSYISNNSCSLLGYNTPGGRTGCSPQPGGSGAV